MKELNFKSYLRRYYFNFSSVAYIFLSAVSGAIPAALIILRADLIDSAALGISGGGADSFFILFVAYCCFFFADVVFQTIISRMAECRRIKQSALIDGMRVEKSSRVKFPVTETKRFYSLKSKAAGAPEADGAMYKAFGTAVRLGVRVIFSIVAIFFVDALTACVVGAMLIVGIFLNVRHARFLEGFWSGYIENSRRADYFSTLLMQREYAAERKTFSFDGEIEKRYSSEFERAKTENVKSGRQRLTAEAIMRLVLVLSTIISVFLLILPLSDGKITAGEFVSTFYAVAGLLAVNKELCENVFSLIENGKKLNGLFEFIALPEDVSSETLSDEQIENIEFKDVRFSYPNASRPVLDGVSFTLKSGVHYALVGENGCGKTTLVKLLLGLYEPDGGEISVNGKSVPSLSPSERKRIFSAVFQDFYKYPVTVRENVSFGLKTPLSDEEMTEAFSALDFHPAAVNGERGYNVNLMPLKKGGVGLSGGEWQKVAVARSMAKKTPVVILDEPNAALDPAAELAVYEAYSKKLADRTTLFISHRFGSVRMADEILVLKDGKLIAKAPHDELIKSCGYYAALYNTQKEMYDEK